MRFSWYPLLALILSTAWVAGCNPPPEPTVDTPSGDELAPPAVDLQPEGDASPDSDPADSAAAPSAPTAPSAATASSGAATASSGAVQQASAIEDAPSDAAGAEDGDQASAAQQQQEDLLALELQLRELLQEKKYQEAIELLEPKVKQEDPDPNLLVVLIQLHRISAKSAKEEGNLDQAQQHFVAAHEMAKKVLTLDLPLGDAEKQFFAEDFVSAAATYAAQQKTDLASEALRKAMELGIQDFEALKDDSSLSALLAADTQLQKELRQAEQAQREQFREELKTLMAGFEPIDMQFTLPDLQDAQVSLDDYRGKVVVADIWGTWCQPCRMALPHFVRLNKEWGEKGVQVVGLTYEGDGYTVEETRETVDPVKQEFGIEYPLLVGDQKTLDQVPDAGAFPTTLLIDRQGQLRLSLVGVRPYALLEEGIKLLLEEEVASQQEADPAAVN